MIEVLQTSLDEVLDIYKPQQRLLLSARIDYPTIQGQFQIPESCFYANCSLQHATDIEIQLCLNQLAYVGIYEAIRLGIDPELRNLNFKELQREKMLIIESRKKFRKPIPTDKPFNGELTLKDKREQNGIILSTCNFQFEDRSCIGHLELALINRQGA